MKTFIGLGVIASMAMVGCAMEEPDTSEDVADLTYAHPPGDGTRKSCPDESCGQTTNGAGIYTDELGSASIYPPSSGLSAMITRFYNTATGVKVDVRFDNPNGTHVVRTYPASQAIVNGQADTLLGLDEYLTQPTFHFLNAGDISGSALVGVSIYIDQTSYTSEGILLLSGKTITFGGWLNEPVMHYVPGTPVQPNDILHSFYVHVNEGYGNTPSTAWAYCTKRDVAGDGNPDRDPVVFQEDIWVNAANGQFERRNGTMTMSCRHGGIATARWWGYSYRNSTDNMYMFETAVAMKRASYCGDGKFYTVDGTNISFSDGAGVNTMLDPAHESSWRPQLEAQWGFDPNTWTIRARCVNMNHLRHTDLQNFHLPNGQALSNFNGLCGGVQVPACPSYDTSTTYIDEKRGSP